MNRFAYSSVEHFCVVLNTIGRQIVGMVVAIPVVSAATRGRRSSPSSIRIGARLDERRETLSAEIENLSENDPRRHPTRRSDDRRTRRGLPSVFRPPSVTTSVDVEAPIGTGMMAENHRSTCRLQRPGDYPALLERYFPCGPVAANQPDKDVDQTTN